MRGKKVNAFTQMGAMAIGIATFAIVLISTFLIMAEGGSQAADIAGNDSVENCASSACNGTKELQSAVDDIPGWVPLIILVMIGSIMIGLVKMFK